MKRALVPLALLTALAVPALKAGTDRLTDEEELLAMVSAVNAASVIEADSATRWTTLTEQDFRLVAGELDVEVAAIKAVATVECGTGNKLEGFWRPGVPVINFSSSMYSKYRAKVSGSKDPDVKVPEGLSGYGLRQWTQLAKACHTNVEAACRSTFWGMFQIGGFNYRHCGCESSEEMARRMSESELEQLELFAAFIRNAGMLDDLKNHNWKGFARKYNGASYAKRGYHTRMAAAYAKFKKEESSL